MKKTIIFDANVPTPLRNEGREVNSDSEGDMPAFPSGSVDLGGLAGSHSGQQTLQQPAVHPFCQQDLMSLVSGGDVAQNPLTGETNVGGAVDDDAESSEEEEVDGQEADVEMAGAPPQQGGCAAVQGAPEEEEAAAGSVDVPVDAETQLVEQGATIEWGDLPVEATGEWTFQGDVCSLRVAGKELKLPRMVYDRLYSYQRQGVAWMWNLFHKEFGGILADEMGLGKTVQIAAFLACLKFTEQASRFLVVVPVTLIQQWRRELQCWSQDTGIVVHVFHGSTHDRKVAIRGMMARGGVLLSSYDLVRTGISTLRVASLNGAAGLFPKKRKRAKRGVRDDDSPSEEKEEDLESFPAGASGDAQLPWDVLVVDEGHQLKNPSCIAGRALRRLDCRSRFILTGTPLQNKLSDLWALMDLAQPGLLGNHATFERNFSEQIAKGSKRNATRFAVELKDHLARELKRLTSPHFLRRLKTDVMVGSTVGADTATPATLPPKTDVVLWLNITQAQRELYKGFLDSEIVRSAAGQSKCGMEALRAIALLKKLCNHPLLCLPPEEFNEWRTNTMQSAPPRPEPQRRPEPEDEVADGKDCQQVLTQLRALVPPSVQGATLLSCKLRVLSVLLPQLQRRGHRCLIFSQSTRMLDLIQGCVLRVLGLKFLRIDGSIDISKRDLKLAKFQQENSNYFCICLSVQVGGVGLTVTGANRVILVDPAWNPATDAQAIDRVHRIGQQREVVVYRLIGAGAIEDKMFRLQVFKRSLAKAALEHEQQIRYFTNKELKQLFEPPTESASTQSLMAEQLGTNALEHEELFKVVAGDIGGTDDPQALPFWQSSDVLGFTDYSRLFMFLEASQGTDEEAGQRAKALKESLQSEEYSKDQVLSGRLRRIQQEERDQREETTETVPLDNGMP